MTRFEFNNVKFQKRRNNMDFGQAFNDFWVNYGEIITSIVSSGSFGALITAIVSSVVKGATRKINTSTTVNMSEAQISSMAKAFAGYVSKKVFNVDISKLLTDEVTAQLSALTTRVESEISKLDLSNNALAVMALAMSRSKLLSEDEQAILKDAASQLANEIKPPEKIELTVTDESDETEQGASTSSSIPLASF